MTVSDISPEYRAIWQVPAFDTNFWRGSLRDYCVIIPVINEGERIHSLLERMLALGTGELADIIIIDGGSTDGSLDRDFLESRDVRALLVKTGPGKLSAQLRCAYAFALDQGYRGVVTIDGNDKDDPASIGEFVATLVRGIDFVQASRFVPGGVAEYTPKLREFAIRWIHAPIISLGAGFRWTDTTQGFRGYSRRLLSDPRLSIFRDVFSTYELLAYLSCRAPRLDYHCVELPSRRAYPESGEVPTKISAVHGNLKLMGILLSACLGRYNK